MKNFYTLFLVLACLFSISSISAQTADEPANGDGSEGDPYQIATLENLYWITQNMSRWGKDYIQIADIDASETSGWDDGNGGDPEGWKPIGINSSWYFSGTYDGGGHVISNLFINRPTTEYVGLFASVSASEIRNLILTNASITGHSKVGGIVGYLFNDNGLVSNCSFSGTVSGDPSVGNQIGGIVGCLYYYAKITNSNSSGEVSGKIRIGGLVGYVNNSSIVEQSFSNSAVSGILRVGGLIGCLNEFSNYSTVRNCYSTGDVTRVSGTDTDFGQFIGRNYIAENKVEYCYSSGNVYYTGSENPTDKGFIGYEFSGSFGANYKSNFFNSGASNQTTGNGATAKSDAEMKTQSTFTDWDFEGIWTIDALEVINSGYPYLQNVPPPPPTFTWDGSESTDWNTAANWDGNLAPTSNVNVLIPMVGSKITPNYPTISSTANCNNLTVENGASLTINFGASLITNGTITNNGTINVEQDIDGGAWHFIAAPVSGAVSEIYDGNYLQKWSEIEQKWLDITTLTEPLTAAKGFSLWYDAKSPGTTFTFSGTPFTGDQSIHLYYDGSKGDPDGHLGTNLVGNPYPSYIDWNELSAYGSKYTWNGTGYDVYVPAGDYGEGSQYVAPMEGFFVVAGSSGSFDLDNTVRTHNSAKKEASAISNAIVLSAQSESYSDALYIVFDESASENFELPRDAWKFISGTRGICQLWTECSDGILAVDVRPQTESIQLGFANNEAGTYSIAIKEIADISTAILEDTKLNIFHNLSDGAYSFDWVLTDDETRFKLHCNTTAVEDISLPEMQVYVAAGNIIIKSQSTAQRIILTDITGRTLGVWESVESIPAPKTAGVYLVSIESDGQRITEKLIVE